MIFLALTTQGRARNNDRVPLFLLTAYAKNQKENLTMAERNEMRKLVPLLVAGYGKKTGGGEHGD